MATAARTHVQAQPGLLRPWRTPPPSLARGRWRGAADYRPARHPTSTTGRLAVHLLQDPRLELDLRPGAAPSHCAHSLVQSPATPESCGFGRLRAVRTSRRRWLRLAVKEGPPVCTKGATVSSCGCASHSGAGGARMPRRPNAAPARGWVGAEHSRGGRWDEEAPDSGEAA
eukprot:scaffold2217_cov132-Isochrysis_galbana.AAC.14